MSMIDRRGITIGEDNPGPGNYAFSGTANKAPVVVITSSNISLDGEQTIDTIAVVDGDRVLVRAQTDARLNGIYVVSTGLWARSSDFDGAGEVVRGTRVFVTSGEVHHETEWYVTTANPIQIGTSNIAFAYLARRSLNPRGAYDNAKTFSFLDVVTDQASSWIYYNDTPGAGNPPPTLPDETNAHWQILARQGEQGIPGPTPVFSIGEVVGLPYGDPPQAAVTGTPEAPVLHLGLPEGAPSSVPGPKGDGLDYDVIVADLTARDVITSPVGVRVAVSDVGDGTSAIYELLNDDPQTWSPPLFIGGGGSGDVSSVLDRDELKALNPSTAKTAVLLQAGRLGMFVWRDGDYSTHIAADPEEGVYIKADSVDADQGAWVRDHTPGIYDVRWFGAVGDGSTDDAAAIQACIDFASATYAGKLLPGGTALVPIGMFKCGSGLLIDAMYVRLEGVGERSIIFTSTDGFDLLTVQEQLCDVKGLSLWNTVPAASHSVLKLNIGAVQCRFEKTALAGGKYCIEIPEGPVDNTFRHIVAQNAWGGATALVRGGTPFFYRCLFNQQWPAGAPTSNSQDKGNHATSTAYSAGDYVVRSSRYLQCMVAGTSDGTAPNLTGVGYQQNIVDGGVTWQIAGVHNALAMLIETGAHYVTCEDCDFTGPFLNSVTVRNSFGGIAPDEIRFDRCTSAGCISGGFFNYAGRRVFYDRCECQAFYSQDTTVAFYVHSTFTGDIEFDGCSAVTPIQYAYFLSHGAGGTAVVRGCSAFGCTTGAYAAAGVTNFDILNNNFGVSAIWGANGTAIRVESGASDYYKIALNRVRGASVGVSDSGSGSNKYLAGNI